MDRPEATLRAVVQRALAEDLGGDGVGADGDLTSRLALPLRTRGRARLMAKADGVLAGLDCAVEAFLLLDELASFKRHRSDGDALRPGVIVLEVEGDMRALLAAERTALNFVQRLSGVATRTRAFVQAVSGTGVKILDTRKTTPGLRELEKAAVRAGGGVNHRIGLFDQVLLKENHFGFARPMTYEDVVRVCTRHQDRPVIAEARDLAEATAAVRGGAGVVLLDNFQPGDSLRSAVRAVQAEAARLGVSVATEASGGVRLENVRSYAECGVDRISIGGITHSAPAVDLSMLVEGVS